ncbi:TnsA-like heteromeric transposase endonuclease subunit [Antrihabitans cavernicola]|uniref:TnsA-like heteromeric transposase endonuclease subunit n=1 Tax=Antrihabitans cavernicola TaxID=2495913 RepID=A0A5A7SB75_9NOCA|nr:TnsA-like heteromeric transposase endonuclease subunit [Spelaeibacter cavernicola]KAA0021785.1 TnsA-like heteromeric transposase endonuclease subunit [Spelaeibacter cavernicola]
MAVRGLLETEARFVSAEGEVVSTQVRHVDGDRAVHGLPVRRIRSFAGQRNYSGLFWSVTTGGHVWYESLLELDRLWLADFDPEVVWIASQPVYLTGMDVAVRRRHTPDLLLKRRDGGFLVVDVKPEKFARLREVAEVFDWTGRVCSARGWRYEVWCGASATLLANVRWISSARRTELIDRAALDAVTSVGEAGMTIAEIWRAASSVVAEPLVKPAVMHLLWTHSWETELSVPLSGQSRITSVTGAP